MGRHCLLHRRRRNGLRVRLVGRDGRRNWRRHERSGSGGDIGTRWPAPPRPARVCAAPFCPGEVVDATSGAETIRIIDCRARDRLTVRADPFPVAQNGMAVRYREVVALYDAGREGERPAHSLSDGRGDAVVQRLDGLDVLGKHQGEASAQGWRCWRNSRLPRLISAF